MHIYTCPTCNKRCTYQRAEDAPSRPFCSERCQQIDLGKWLREDYRISDPASGGDFDDQPGATPAQE